MAAYQKHHQICLDGIDPKSRAHKVSPTTCNQTVLNQTLGTFTMSISFAGILQFETLNTVQVNGFDQNNGKFFPENFVLHFRLCNGGHHHKTTTSTLKNLWTLFATCEDLIVDSPSTMIETSLIFVQNGLKVTAYSSVTVGKSTCCHSFTFKWQLRTTHSTHTNSQLAATWFVICFDFEPFLRTLFASKGTYDKIFP